MSSSPRLLNPAFVKLCVAVFFGAHAPNLFVVAPPYLRAHHLNEQHVGIVMGAFALAALFLMPFVARFAERYGRRAPLVAGMLCCSLGCVAFGWSTDVIALVAARAVQGIGWAGVLVGGAIYTTELAPPGRLAQALGVAGVLTLLAMALGPAIGELVAAQGSYLWVFRIAALMALTGAVIASQLPEPTRVPLAPGAPAPAWSALDVATLRPLAATFLVATGFGAIIAFLADYMREAGFGAVSPFFTSYVAAAIAARLTLGGLSDRLGRHPVIIPALVGQALALGGLALMGAPWELWLLGAVFGFSHGMYYPALQALVVDRAAAPVKLQAVASSNFAFSLGIAVSAFGNGAVAKAAGYPAVYAVTAGLAAAAIVILVVDGRGAARR